MIFSKMLLPRGLTVFQEFVLIVGIGIGAVVERLLEKELGFEQVAHLGDSRPVVIAVQAEVLFCLLDATLGYLKLLV